MASGARNTVPLLVAAIVALFDEGDGVTSGVDQVDRVPRVIRAAQGTQFSFGAACTRGNNSVKVLFKAILLWERRKTEALIRNRTAGSTKQVPSASKTISRAGQRLPSLELGTSVHSGSFGVEHESRSGGNNRSDFEHHLGDFGVGTCEWWPDLV